MLSSLERFLPLLQFALVLLVLAVVTYLVLLVLKARKQAAEIAEEQEPGTPTDEDEDVGERIQRGAGLALRQSFASGIRQLSELESGHEARYQIPWVAMVGQEGSRPDELLRDAGFALPLGPPAPDYGSRWWFLDSGVVIDLDGEFVLSDDGQAHDDRGWATFLRLLQRHRPERPIDSVVLTIACSELLTSAPQRLAEIEQKATEISERIWLAQKRLGLRFPVYVVVTGCEVLRGFSEFWDGLSNSERTGMLGWSSPYGLDVSYRSEWLDEAQNEVGGRLRQIRLRQLARPWVLDNADEVFLLPDELRSLKPSLQAYLDQIFRPSAYHSSVLFRGLYFCGTSISRPDTANIEAPDQEQPVAETVFLKDLFERKVFPEAGLSRPAATTLVSSNRAVRWAQAALVATAVLLSLGLWWAHDRLAERQQELLPFLQLTDNKLFGAGLASGGRGPAEEGPARIVLDSMAGVDGRQYSSFFLPSSWFSRFDDRLERVFERTYLEVMHAFHRRLGESTRTSLVEQRTVSTQTSRGLVSIENLPEFKAVHRYLQNLLELEAVTELYNCLGQVEGGQSLGSMQRCRGRTGDLQALDQVVHYLLGSGLRPDFFQQSDHHRRGLARVSYVPFNLGDHRPQAQQTARDLFGKLFDRLFERSELTVGLEKLEDDLRRLGDLTSSEQELSRLRRILDLSQQVEMNLSSGIFEWAFRKEYDLGSEYRGLLDMAQESRLLSSRATETESELQAITLLSAIESRGREQWSDYRSFLASLHAPISGPLLDHRDGWAVAEISEDLQGIRTAIAQLTGEQYARPVPAGALLGGEARGTRVRWQVPLLEEAVSFFNSFERMRTRDLAEFDSSLLRGSLESVARESLGDSIRERIVRARRVEGTLLSSDAFSRDGLETEVQLFKGAAPALHQLLGIFSQLGLLEHHDWLSNLVRGQSLDLLSQVDRALSRSEYLLPRSGDFIWWDGKEQLAFAAYSVDDPEGLAEYVATQQNLVSGLAEGLARPLILTLKRVPGSESEPLRQKWERILTDLAEARDKKPGNVLASLEDWVLKELPVANLGNCFDHTVFNPGRADGFFGERSNQLRERLLNRCRTLISERALDSYSEIAEFFNQRLANRLPFTPGAVHTGGLEADPLSIREFFRIYDLHQGPVRLALEDERARSAITTFGDAETKIRQFIKQIGDVRELFDSFLAGTDPTPGFDFEVQFRVNKDREVDGDQIVDWRLESGEQTVVFPDPEPAGSWQAGDPIRLSLRWASNSPWQPTRSPDRPDVAVHNGEVVFEYNNRWSLLSFIRAHPTPPAELGTERDFEPHTLRFAVDTEYRGTADDGPARFGTREREINALVFVRVALVTPDKALSLPTFPYQAPRLHQPTTLASDGSP